MAARLAALEADRTAFEQRWACYVVERDRLLEVCDLSLEPTAAQLDALRRAHFDETYISRARARDLEELGPLPRSGP